MNPNRDILPGSPVPDLALPLVGGGKFDISARQPETFTVVVAYRGLHCPICRKQLTALRGKLDAFGERGAEAVAVSMDGEDRARRSVEEWDLAGLPVGYDLSEQTARAWGLYISRSIKDEEPRLFSEPGLFLVRPDATLYAASVQTMPFARPAFDDILDAIDFIAEKDYPPRGDVSGIETRPAA